MSVNRMRDSTISSKRIIVLPEDFAFVVASDRQTNVDNEFS